MQLSSSPLLPLLDLSVDFSRLPLLKWMALLDTKDGDGFVSFICAEQQGRG